MGLFSGDGAGILARRLRKYGAQIIGGLHLKMPDSIADEKALKRIPDSHRYFSIVPCSTTNFPNNVIACFGQMFMHR